MTNNYVSLFDDSDSINDLPNSVMGDFEEYPAFDATHSTSNQFKIIAMAANSEIKAFLEILHPPGSVFEIRILDCPDGPFSSKKSTVSGYFNDVDAAAKEIVEYHRRNPPGIFVSLNPVEAGLLARGLNCLAPYAKNTTKDEEVICRTNLFVDIDPSRHAGISSTESELQAATDLSDKLKADMIREGWPEPVEGMSGNGRYLIWQIDLPNNDVSTDLIKAVLIEFSQRYDTPDAKIDKSTYNASRICKVLGTIARKGAELIGIPGVEDRPHRKSWFKKPPRALQVVSEDLLRSLLPPSTASSKPATNVNAKANANASRLANASKRLAELPPAIAGQNGSNALFHACCEMMRMGLEDSEVLELILEEFNPRCTPKWNSPDVEHKIQAARRKTSEDGKKTIIPYRSREQTSKANVITGKASTTSGMCGNAKAADPKDEAERFLNSLDHHGTSTLVYWNSQYLKWENGKYEMISSEEVRALITRSLNENFTAVTIPVVSNVLNQVNALSMLNKNVPIPSWRESNSWKLDEVVAARNVIVHLPSYVSGLQSFSIPSTPALFTTNALDFDFDASKPDCPTWKEFLKSIWADDQASIDTLQEIFGYCLTPDTRQQKILMLIGVPRSGKGTICRVLKSLIGDGNVCAPTLASLQSTFGLSPLIGKSIAIIADARLSGRADQKAIVERLLAISGEDNLTIDRKHLSAVTMTLRTRLILLTNELPRLQDNSGAFTGRMLILKFEKSFAGREDPDLLEKLIREKAGILEWAILGWKRLHERGHFTQPESGLDTIDDLNDLSSPIGTFVRERCEIGPDHEICSDDLYSEWCTWCDKYGHRKISKATFGRDLKTLYPSLKKSKPREGESRILYYVGIRLAVESFSPSPLHDQTGNADDKRSGGDNRSNGQDEHPPSVNL
jgi:putative DNA primase/helicase